MLYIHCNFKLTSHSKKLSYKVELCNFFICNINFFLNIINAFIYLLLFNCKFNTKGFVELEYNSLVRPLTLTEHMKISKLKGVKMSNIIINLESLFLNL